MQAANYFRQTFFVNYESELDIATAQRHQGGLEVAEVGKNVGYDSWRLLESFTHDRHERLLTSNDQRSQEAQLFGDGFEAWAVHDGDGYRDFRGSHSVGR